MKRLIIVTHVGTSVLECIQNELDPLVELLRELNNDDICLAFTSKLSKLRLLEKGREVLTFDEALTYGINSRAEEILVLPLHVVGGLDYKMMKDIIDGYKDTGNINLMKPLLSSKEDCSLLSKALIKTLSPEDHNLPILFVGHGVSDDTSQYYQNLENELIQRNVNAQVMTLDDDVKEKIDYMKLKGITEVVLYPLFVIAGYHVKKDLFESENSIYSQLISNGFKVKSYTKGLISHQDITMLYKNKVSEKINTI